MKSSVKLGVILIGLIIFSYAGVWGANWKFYSSSRKYFFYYDTEGITLSQRNILKVWEKKVYKEEGVIDAVRDFGKSFEKLGYEIVLLEVNCADKKLRLLSVIYYSDKGDVIYSIHNPSEWSFIMPESVGEALYKAVCK